MKRSTLLSLLLVTLLSPLGAADKAEQEITTTLESIRQSILKKDTATLEKIFHPDLTYSHSTGMTETKDQAIKAFAKGLTQSFEMSDMKIRVYGNTGLAKGKLVTVTKGSNNDQPIQLSVLHVFLKTPQGWQLVARQSTRLNP